MRIFLPGLQISLFLSGRPFSTAEIHGWNITGVYSFERNFVLDSRETSLFTDNGEGDTTPKAAKEQATNKPALNVSRFFFRRARNTVSKIIIRSREKWSPSFVNSNQNSSFRWTVYFCNWFPNFSRDLSEIRELTCPLERNLLSETRV